MKPGTLIIFLIVFIFLKPGLRAQLPVSGLIAYYPFNGNANDGSGNNNNGVNYGAQLTTDRFGNPNSAYYFDGNNKYISVPSSPSLTSPTNKLTMAAWAMVTGPAARHYILDKRLNFDTSPPYTSYVLLTAPQTQIQTWQTFVSPSLAHPTGTSTLKENIWTFIVGVYDGANLSLYVDGILEVSAPCAGNITYSTLPLYIGAVDLKPLHSMNGKIDDIRIYNRVLTPEEIWILYKETVTPVPFISGNQKVCAGSKGVNYLVSNMDSIINYSWNYYGFGVSISGSGNNISVDFAENASSGPLAVIGNKADGSKDTARIEITVNPVPIAMAGSNTPICEGNQIVFTAGQVSGGSYQWTGPGGFSSSVQNPVINFASISDEGTYSLTVTSNGCLSTPSIINVMVQPLPRAVASSNSPVCEGNQILLQAQPVSGGTYVWTGPGGFSSFAQNPVINNASLTDKGRYTLRVSANGCISLQTEVDIVVNICQNADLSILKTINKTDPLVGESVIFTIIASNIGNTDVSGVIVEDILQNGYTYISSTAGMGIYNPGTGTWTIGTLVSGSSQSLIIIASVNPNGSYVNTASIQGIINETNMSNNYSTTTAIPFYFNIPNSFSPNGDDINDAFVIRGLNENSRLIIFNRSGKKIYESENYQNDWKGKDSEGNVLDSGTYWYHLTLPGIPTDFKGFVYLKK